MFVTSKKMTAAVLAITLAMSLSACSNWSKRDRNTAIGAGAGALGGAVLTDGSTLGTLKYSKATDISVAFYVNRRRVLPSSLSLQVVILINHAYRPGFQ